MEKEGQEVDLSLRHFIKSLGGIAGGTLLLSTAPWLTSCTPEKLNEVKNERKARIGLIGTGSRGQYHIHNIITFPHAELVALCDNYKPNLDAALALVPTARTYTDYRQLLEADDIDGVVIATPLSLHAGMTLDALAAGKHVFCEKAMALTLEDCRRVYEASVSSNKALYFCMQRMYDEKYVQGVQMIKSGLIGDVVGMRCHWFRNADWRREVPSPELERKINWRLYKEFSGGLMTELGSHQLEVCNWVMGRVPRYISGMGDIVHWKDGREVYDTVSVVYKYETGQNICYESLISNKFNGMEEQILGSTGTVDLSKGVYYLEDDQLVSSIRQLVEQIKNGVQASIPTAGPSWRPELKSDYIPHPILEKNSTNVTKGESMIGVENDGSDAIMSAFCQSCITGEKAPDVVAEAYYSSVLCLLGNLSMAENRVVEFPEDMLIPYMGF